MVKPKATAGATQGDTVVAKVPVIRSDAEQLRILYELVGKAPDAPIFNNLSEVTAWLDSTYNRWLNQVRSEVPK